MAQLSYVSLVPKESSGKLRQILSEEDTGPLVWREVRAGWGSEFHFTGPTDLVRRTHEFVTLWVANEKLARTVGKTAAAPSGAPWRPALVRRTAAAAGFLAFLLVAFTAGHPLG